MKITIKNNINCKCYSEHTSDDDYEVDNELYDEEYDEDEEYEDYEDYDEEYNGYDDEDHDYADDEDDYDGDEDEDEDYEYLDGNCGEEMPNERSIYDMSGLRTEFIKKWTIR